MADEKILPPILSATGEYGDDFVRKVQERIEEGKRNAPEILRLVAMNTVLKNQRSTGQ